MVTWCIDGIGPNNAILRIGLIPPHSNRWEGLTFPGQGGQDYGPTKRVKGLHKSLESYFTRAGPRRLMSRIYLDGV